MEVKSDAALQLEPLRIQLGSCPILVPAQDTDGRFTQAERIKGRDHVMRTLCSCAVLTDRQSLLVLGFCHHVPID